MDWSLVSCSLSDFIVDLKIHHYLNIQSRQNYKKLQFLVCPPQANSKINFKEWVLPLSHSLITDRK